MSINFEYYKIFYYVAKFQNITHAANELCVTQPNVSKSIQNLESQIGVKLFYRSKRGVFCTPEGTILYEQIKPACEGLLSAETDLKRRSSLEHGIIKISTPDLALKTILLPTIQEFNGLYPNVTLKIVRSDTKDASTELNSGAIDLFLEYAEVDQSKPMFPVNIRNSEILMQPLGIFYDIPIVGPKYAFLAEKEVSFRELMKYPIILSTVDTFSSRSYYVNRIWENGGRISMEISGVDKRISLVENDIGITFLPREFVDDEIKKGMLYPVRLNEKLLKRQLILKSSLVYQSSLAAKAFSAMLLKNTQQYLEHAERQDLELQGIKGTEMDELAE